MEIRIRLGQQRLLKPMNKIVVVTPGKLVLITSGFGEPRPQFWGQETSP